MAICFNKAIVKAKSEEKLKIFYNDFLSEDKNSLLMNNVIPLEQNTRIPLFLLWGTSKDIFDASIEVDGNNIKLDDDFNSDIIVINYSSYDSPNELFWCNCCLAYDLEIDLYYYDSKLEYAGQSYFNKNKIEKDNTDCEVSYYEADGINVINSLNLYDFLIKNNMVSYEYMYNIFIERQKNKTLNLCDMKAIQDLNKLYNDFNFEFTNQVIYDISQEEEIPDIGGD